MFWDAVGAIHVGNCQCPFFSVISHDEAVIEGQRWSEPIVRGAWKARVWFLKQPEAKIISIRAEPPGDVYSVLSSLWIRHTSTALMLASHSVSSIVPAVARSWLPAESIPVSITQLKSPPTR